MPLGIFVLGLGFLMGSGIFGDTMGLVAFILGFVLVCSFSALRHNHKLSLLYGVNFGIGMIIGVLSFIAVEGSAGSGIVFAWIGFGTIGSIALGNVTVSLELKRSLEKQHAKEQADERAYAELVKRVQERERFEAKKAEIIAEIIAAIDKELGTGSR